MSDDTATTDTPTTAATDTGVTGTPAAPATSLPAIEDVEEAMRDVVDPELGINVVDLGLVYGIEVTDDAVAKIDMTLTSAACPLTDVIEDQSRGALVSSGLCTDLEITWVWLPPWGPDTIPDESAAQLVAMPFSAITLLDHLDVSSGDWIIQNAANGAVGRMLSRLAAARGVNCVSLVRRADGVAELQASGIANAVSTAENGWQDRVREITAGAAIRVGVDSVGGTASGDLAALIGDNGRMVVFGSMTAQPVVIPPGEFIFRNLTLRGFWGSSVMARLPQERRAALMGEVIGRVMSGDLPLPVDGIFGLDRPADAVRASLTPGKVGKVMFRP